MLWQSDTSHLSAYFCFSRGKGPGTFFDGQDTCRKIYIDPWFMELFNLKKKFKNSIYCLKTTERSLEETNPQTGCHHPCRGGPRGQPCRHRRPRVGENEVSSSPCYLGWQGRRHRASTISQWLVSRFSSVRTQFGANWKLVELGGGEWKVSWIGSAQARFVSASLCI
jgi:hypothetical protein